MIIAGSASEAIIISRDDADAAEAGADIHAASACAKPGAAQQGGNGDEVAGPAEHQPCLAKVGTSAAATQVVAKMKYGAARNSQEAFSASTTSLPSKRRKSR